MVVETTVTAAKRRIAGGPKSHPSWAKLHPSDSTPAPITPVIMCAIAVHIVPVRSRDELDDRSNGESSVYFAIRLDWLVEPERDVWSWSFQICCVTAMWLLLLLFILVKPNHGIVWEAAYVSTVFIILNY